jgi:hypothetical protein
MAEVYSVHAVFTPTTQARVNFVQRSSVNDRLVDALMTPGKQLVVYGESGSGKSTLLLKKLEELYPDHITTRCYASMSFDHLLLDAFDQLDKYYLDTTKNTAGQDLSTALSADFLRIRAGITAKSSESDEESRKRVVPPQLTPQRLGEFLGAQELCWVLEDFHKVPTNERQPLSQAFKIFSDLSASYPNVKIVAIGAAETARQVVEYDSEMINRIAEIQVPLMIDNELREIVNHGQTLLNIDLTVLRETFVQYSVGVPSICHQLALNACLEAGVMQTQSAHFLFESSHLEPAIRRWVSESSDTLKATFDRALKRHKVRQYDNTRLILSALAAGPLTGMLYSEILREVQKTEHHYPPANLTTYLKQLTADARGNILRIGADGRYRFVDPLHHTYGKAFLLEARPTISAEDLAHELDQLAENLKNLARENLKDLARSMPNEPLH